jgi:hypothetical protein
MVQALSPLSGKAVRRDIRERSMAWTLPLFGSRLEELRGMSVWLASAISPPETLTSS